MHIKVLNYHKVLVGEGVGVTSGLRVSVGPGTHRMFIASLFLVIFA